MQKERHQSTDSADSAENVVLTAENIHKSYGSELPFTRTVEVLTGANMELGRGEIVGIVGANGSGKSTLMKILVGALKADEGTVTQNGTIGWCPQEPLLYDRLTIKETFELFGRGYGLTVEEIEEARDRLITQLKFEQFLDYRVENLSGGNQQKMNLSCSLLHDPDILLLDEPYTGFDWETYLEFWELTENLIASGTTIAIISHIIRERDRFDRIYEFRDGTLCVKPNEETAGHEPENQITIDDGSASKAPIDKEGTDKSAAGEEEVGKLMDNDV